MTGVVSMRLDRNRNRSERNQPSLHWPQLDEDYPVPGPVNGVFGTAKWLAARAGRGKAEAKAAAARANGAKGGRPRRVG